MDKIQIKIKTPKPFCRTPIKPVQAHKNSVKYSRQPKHRNKENYAH
jgi:hypothetical protein